MENIPPLSSQINQTASKQITYPCVIQETSDNLSSPQSSTIEPDTSTSPIQSALENDFLPLPGTDQGRRYSSESATSTKGIFPKSEIPPNNDPCNHATREERGETVPSLRVSLHTLSFKHRLALAIITPIVVFALSGLSAGYSPLKEVLIMRGSYSWLCNPLPNMAQFDVSMPYSCQNQLLHLDMMNTLANALGAFIIVPVGIFLDKFGPRLLYMLSCVVFALGSLFISLFFRLDLHTDLLTPGFIMISSAGSAIFAASFHVSNTFPKRASWLTLSFNVAFDLSAMIFSLLQLSYAAISSEESRASLLFYFFLLYTLLSALVFFTSLFLMPKLSINASPLSSDASLAETVTPTSPTERISIIVSSTEPPTPKFSEHLSVSNPAEFSSGMRGLLASEIPKLNASLDSPRLRGMMKNNSFQASKSPISITEKVSNGGQIETTSSLDIGTSSLPFLAPQEKPHTVVSMPPSQTLGRRSSPSSPVSRFLAIQGISGNGVNMQKGDAESKPSRSVYVSPRSISFYNAMKSARDNASTAADNTTPSISRSIRNRSNSLVVSNFVPASVLKDFSSLRRSRNDTILKDLYTCSLSDGMSPANCVPIEMMRSEASHVAPSEHAGSTGTFPRQLKESDLKFIHPAQTEKVCLSLQQQSIKNQYKSRFYYLFVVNVALTVSLVNYFVLTVNNQLRLLDAGNERYQLLNVWGMVLPLSGVAIAPFLGFWVAYIPYHLSFTLVSSMALLGAACMQLRVLNVQYLTMVCIGLLRPIVWTVSSDYVGKVFGFESFGRLYGTLLLCVGVFNFISYGLNYLALAVLNSYFIPNLILLIVQGLSFVFPITLYLWHRSLRQSSELTVAPVAKPPQEPVNPNTAQDDRCVAATASVADVRGLSTSERPGTANGTVSLLDKSRPTRRSPLGIIRTATHEEDD